MAKAPFKRSFTLLELLVAIVTLSFIVSLAIASVRGYQDRVAMRVDETNMKILHAAIRVAAVSSGVVAGSLSELRPSDLEQAYALVTEGKRPYTFLAYLGEAWRQTLGNSGAEANDDGFVPPRLYDSDLKVITCLRDRIPPSGFDPDGRPIGGRSYDIHPQAQGRPLSWFNDPANARLVLLFECTDDAHKREFRHGGRFMERKKGQVEMSVRGRRGLRGNTVSVGIVQPQEVCQETEYE